MSFDALRQLQHGITVSKCCLAAPATVLARAHAEVKGLPCGAALQHSGWPGCAAMHGPRSPAPRRSFSSSQAVAVSWQHPCTTMSPELVRQLRGVQNDNGQRGDALKSLTDWADKDLSRSHNVRPVVWVCYNPTPDDYARYTPDQKAAIDKCRAKAATLKDAGGHVEFVGDAERAYKLAVAAVAAQRPQYAAKAAELLRVWADTCKEFGPDSQNGPLEAGWGGSSMAMAAELLKHTWDGWDASGTEPKFRSFFERLLMPNLKRYIDPNTGLLKGFVATGNWGSTITCARLQYAIFTEDAAALDWCNRQAVKLLETLFPGGPDGDGRNLETLRDLIHAQYELAGMTALFETLYHQGIDLYPLNNNCLMRSFEFHASIIMGSPPDSIKNNPELHGKPGEEVKGSWKKHPKPVIANWEIAYAHYVGRKGLAMPQSLRILSGEFKSQNPGAKDFFQRPEDFQMHWGLGTLTHYRAPGQTVRPS